MVAAVRNRLIAAAGISVGCIGAGLLLPPHARFWVLGIVGVSAVIALLELRFRKMLALDSTEKETLRESELRFRNAFQEAAVGMVILDVAGRVQSVNRGFTDFMLYSAEELIGKPLKFLISAEYHADIAVDRRLVLEGKLRSYRRERQFIRKDGIPVWVRTSVSRLQLAGEPHTIALVEDISEQKQAREKLSRQAMHDPLTGLPNRRHFEEVLDIALALAKTDATKNVTQPGTRHGTEVALVYVDLDGFKLVNDTLGHRFGDLLLIEVARRIRECIKDSDLLARVGGDEFTIVLPGLDGPEVPAGTVERILKSLNSPFYVEGHEINIGASAGVSRYPIDGLDSSALLQSADAAMYCAKRSGINRYRFFSSQMREDAHRRLAIESRLRRALDCHEISIQFQPQYELAGNNLVRFEALCRWFNAELGQVAPDCFIPIAEETGLIVEIGNYVMREACRQALKWSKPGGVGIAVAVNVSAIQFARADFVSSVVDVLRETGLKPALLELEMTESSLIRDRDDGIGKMERLKSLGVQISMDDFGTGYSSLSYLQNLPLDALKIDRSFTAKLGSSHTAMSMIRAIIAMARALGLRVVTEGVENASQAEILRRLGSDEVQGYYFGRPEDAAASVERVLAEMRSEASQMVAAS
jgi:diguanylate cyclase (GGDEF)-like protein/PAS domain S-box-containing protein